MSITRTSPAWALPGAIHSPGLAAWKVAVASARTAVPATSPVEASTPLGTSQATTDGRARRPRLIASIAPAAGSRGSPAKPVPRIASTIAAAPSERRRPEQAPAPDPGRRSKLVRASPRSSSAGPRAARDTSRPCSRSSARDDEPVAAVVALAAHDDDPARGRQLGDELAPARRRRAPSARGRGSRARRSPTRRARAARAASGSGSSQSGRVIRGSRPLRHRDVRVGQRDSHLDPELAARSATAPCSRTCGGPPPPTTSTSRKLQASSPERLGHRLLGAEPRGQVLPGPRARGRICSLAIGEQPLRQPRAGARAPARAARSRAGRCRPAAAESSALTPP